MSAGDTMSLNLEKAAALIGQAKQSGAKVSVLPECFALMPRDRDQRLSECEPGDRAGPVELALQRLAAEHGMWIISAGIFTAAGTSSAVRNTCFVHDDRGRRVARYDKIHLFDVSLSADERYFESSYTEPGDSVQVADTPAGKVGLSICYDVRFPELYRRLANLDASWFVVPSAFSHTTGSRHWEVLLRARAIENFAYVVAPAQYGEHPGGRRTYGHTMIVDPWGTVLASRAQGDGVVVSELNAERAGELRAAFAGCVNRRRLTVIDGH